MFSLTMPTEEKVGFLSESAHIVKKMYRNPISICFKKTTFPSQQTFTCSKLTIERLDKGVKYVQSFQ